MIYTITATYLLEDGDRQGWVEVIVVGGGIGGGRDHVEAGEIELQWLSDIRPQFQPRPYFTTERGVLSVTRFWR